jgi:DNA-binding HxlR family transcriptional regulator
MTEGSYKQFCPVAMASEALCSRWTMIIVRELVCGSTRFNDLKRGVPRMSPALLSKRLRDLEAAGIVSREATGGKAGGHEYRLTPSGRELEPIVKAFGIWGQRWMEANPSLQNLDPELLMWDMRRSLNLSALPRRRSVVQFTYSDLPQKKQRYWLLVEANGAVDVCSIDPGFDVDLYVATDLRTMTAVWLGITSLRTVMDDNAFVMVGNRELESTLPAWIGLSPFAVEPKLARPAAVE